MRGRPERASLPRSLDGWPRPSGRYGATDPACHRLASYAVYRTRHLERWFEAEDRYQTAWVAMLEKRERLRYKGARAYLERRAFGSVIDSMRESIRRRHGWNDALALRRLVDLAPSPEEMASLDEAIGWIHQLPPLDRDIALAVMDGTTQEEIAAAHGLHVARVTERWQWLRRHLRRRYVGLISDPTEDDELALACESCAAKPFGQATPAAHAQHLGDAERWALGMHKAGW